MPDTPSLPETTPTHAHERDTPTVLLDVREPDEWAAGHAPDARHLPLADIDPADFPADTDVLCICRSGGRSAKATEALRAAGINATNVTGGMNAWGEAGLPVVRSDGEPGTVI
ncbi:MAG: rhodanese-like domain-containing protein [Acidimicrobiales bacterium]|nr:rhodanese-like domain-containing protein [Acidimicrobiales bacterium]